MQYPDRIVMQFVSNLHGTRIRMSLQSHLHASPVPTIHGLTPPLPKNEASYRPSVSRTHTDTHTDAPQKTKMLPALSCGTPSLPPPQVELDYVPSAEWGL